MSKTTTIPGVLRGMHLPRAPRDQAAVTDWEDEGGSLAQGVERAVEVDAAGYPPALPPGYSALPAWDFCDESGRLTYEFNRVYGPPDPQDRRGAIARLDRDLSYWSVTRRARGETAGEAPWGRSISYARARSLAGRRMTFARFSSLVEMRRALPALLAPDKRKPR